MSSCCIQLQFLYINLVNHRVSKPAYFVPVPSQDKLGGCARKGIRHKKVGMAEVVAPMSGWGGSPSGLLVCLPVLSSFCTRKSRRWRNVPSGTGSPGLSRTKREIRVALTWELLYADDLIVIAETEDDLIKGLNKWKDDVENRGMRVSMNKTKVMISADGRR